MFDLIAAALAALVALVGAPAGPAPEPTVTVQESPAPEPEPEVVEDEADEPDPTEIDPEEEVISEEENAAEVAAICAEWGKPDHGTWALDPGDEDAEYTESMDAFCDPVLAEPDPTEVSPDDLP